MNNNRIMMKGINIPCAIVFLHGFLDGCLDVACIDHDNNILNSAYVNGKMDLYRKYCQERIRSI